MTKRGPKRLLKLTLLAGLTMGCETQTGLEKALPPKTPKTTTQPTSHPTTQRVAERMNSYEVCLVRSEKGIIEKYRGPSPNIYHPLKNPGGHNYAVELVDEGGKPISTRTYFSFGNEKKVVIRFPKKEKVAGTRTYHNGPTVILETGVKKSQQTD